MTMCWNHFWANCLNNIWKPDLLPYIAGAPSVNTPTHLKMLIFYSLIFFYFIHNVDASFLSVIFSTYNNSSCIPTSVKYLIKTPSCEIFSMSVVSSNCTANISHIEFLKWSEIWFEIFKAILLFYFYSGSR